MRRVSVDIGGTFTDCFLVYDGQYIEAKALTTHHNLASGFMEALENACSELNSGIKEVLSSVDAVRYATTLGTNALIRTQRSPRWFGHDRRLRIDRTAHARAWLW